MKQIKHDKLIEIIARVSGQWIVKVSNPHWNNTPVGTWDPGCLLCGEFVDKLQELHGEEEMNNIWFEFSSENIYSFKSKEEAEKFFQIFNTGKLYSSSFYAILVSPEEGIVDENT